MKKLTEKYRSYIDRLSVSAIRELQKKKREGKKKRNCLPYHSSLIDYWFERSTLKDKEGKKGRLILKIPENFSIIENPEETINAINIVVNSVRSDKKIRLIKCDHSQMIKHDLAAESLLGLLAKEFERECKESNRKLKIEGLLPKDEYLTRFIKAIGLIKDLNIKHEFLPKELENALSIFNVRNKIKKDTISSGALGYKELTAKRFVDHINSCLGKINKCLTSEARDRLAEYAGEILANADEHGGLKDWTIRGYFDAVHNEHHCEIAIFNFGKTIADTFLDLHPESFAFKQVESFIDLHSSKGFFSKSWTKEALITLAALQGDISCKNEDATGDRGQGTVEMIQFFQRIHTECSNSGLENAKMALLSGRCHILFDGTYQMNENEDGRKIIAFNKDNSLMTPPDCNYIKDFGRVLFPGTIISIKFLLEETNFRNVENEKNH